MWGKIRQVSKVQLVALAMVLFLHFPVATYMIVSGYEQGLHLQR